VAAFQADPPTDAKAMGGSARAPAQRIGNHDAQFISLASQAGQQEVADARLAVMMTRRDDVKKAAQMLQQDHGAANALLSQLVKAKGWSPPQPLDLSPGPGADGSYSDAQYIRNQIDAHKISISLFEAEVGAGEDEDLRGFAKTLLPNLRHHLVALQNLSRI